MAKGRQDEHQQGERQQTMRQHISRRKRPRQKPTNAPAAFLLAIIMVTRSMHFCQNNDFQIRLCCNLETVHFLYYIDNTSAERPTESDHVVERHLASDPLRKVPEALAALVRVGSYGASKNARHRGSSWTVRFVSTQQYACCFWTTFMNSMW
jgi:hypothetical protein